MIVASVPVLHVCTYTFPWLPGYGAESAQSEPPHSRHRTRPTTVPEDGGRMDVEPYGTTHVTGLCSEWQTGATEQLFFLGGGGGGGGGGEVQVCEYDTV